MPDRTPHIGEMVAYILTVDDANAIAATVTPGNAHKEGDHLAALVVRVWPAPATGEQLVQLQVFPDGRGTFWATSRANGDEPGKWYWPEHSRGNA